MSTFFVSKLGLLALWALVAAVALGVCGYVAFRQGVVPSINTIAYAIAASSLFWLPILLLFTDPEATLGTGPRLRLAVVTTCILVGLAGFAAYDHFNSRLLESEPVRVAFFSLMALGFIPRIWNAIAFWRFKAQNRKAAEDAIKLNEAQDALANRHDDVEQKVSAYRAAESTSAFIVTVLVLGIVATAYYVGTFPSDPSLGASLGVGIFVVVISLFAIVLAVDWLSDMAAIRDAGALTRLLAKPGAFFASIYDAADGVLVYIGGHVAGADHLRALSRYLILGMTLGALGVMGWYLPPPWGLAPVLAGLVVGLSVSRLWSWVEEDRNLASITQFSAKAPQRMGFREDFRDETLLGFIFVLALIPVGMMQAHQSNLLGGPLFVNVSDAQTPIAQDNFFVWLGYFGFELAKALPIVDWADIYHLGPGSDSIAPTRPLGMHAVFVARVLVDLLLIAALLQAIGIASRNRQQKFLYAEGHIDRLDQLVEKHELTRAIRAAERQKGEKTNGSGTKKPAVNISSDLVDFRRYSEARLREIFLRTDRKDIREFITAIFAQRGITPAPAMVTVQNIAETHRSELDLIRTFDEAKAEHKAAIYTITLEDLATVLFELRHASGMREFKFELIDFALTLAPKDKCLDVLTTVAAGAGRDQYIYTRRHAGAAILVVLPQVVNRDMVLSALTEFESRGEHTFGAARSEWEAIVSALKRRLEELGDQPV